MDQFSKIAVVAVANKEHRELVMSGQDTESNKHKNPFCIFRGAGLTLRNISLCHFYILFIEEVYMEEQQIL